MGLERLVVDGVQGKADHVFLLDIRNIQDGAAATPLVRLLSVYRIGDCDQDNAADGEATVAAIQAAGGAIAVKGDMTKQEDVALLVAAARESFGDSIDILVNVVGGLVARKPLAEMDAAAPRGPFRDF